MANLAAVRTSMQQLLQQLREAVLMRDQAVLARREAHEAVDRKHGPIVEVAEARLRVAKQELRDQVAAFLEALLPEGSRTLKLNGGSIQLRELPESIEIIDEAELFASLKKHHAFSRCVEIVLKPNLNAIKKLRFFNKLRGVRKVGGTSTIVRLDGVDQPIRL